MGSVIAPTRVFPTVIATSPITLKGAITPLTTRAPAAATAAAAAAAARAKSASPPVATVAATVASAAAAPPAAAAAPPSAAAAPVAASAAAPSAAAAPPSAAAPSAAGASEALPSFCPASVDGSVVSDSAFLFFSGSCLFCSFFFSGVSSSSPSFFSPAVVTFTTPLAMLISAL